MDAVDALEQAWQTHAKQIAGLHPDHLSSPTGCARWDARSLINHTLGEALMMTAANRGELVENDHGDLVGDGAGLSGICERVAEENVGSWRESGVTGDRAYSYGTFPATAAAAINLGEVLVHAWDLSKATGLPLTLDEAVVEPVFALYSNIPLDGMRAGGMLAPEVPVPTTAPIGDRLLGLLGREPTP